jgi:hypothetical protein
MIIASVRGGTVTVDLTLSGDTVTAVVVTNNDTVDAYLDVSTSNGATTVIANKLCPAGQVTTTSIQKNRQFNYANAADWRIGVSR